MNIIIPKLYNQENKIPFHQGVIGDKNLKDDEARFILFIAGWINFNATKHDVNYCEISYNEIEKQLSGWNRKKIARVIKKLREKGYILTETGKKKQRYMISSQNFTSVQIGTTQNDTGVQIDTANDDCSVRNGTGCSVRNGTANDNIGVQNGTGCSVQTYTAEPSSNVGQDEHTTAPNILNKYINNINKISKEEENEKSNKNLTDEKLRPILKKIFYSTKQTTKPSWETITDYVADVLKMPFLTNSIKQQIPTADEKTYYRIAKTIFYIFIYKQEQKRDARNYILRGIVSKVLSNTLDSYGQDYVYFNDKFSRIIKAIKKEYERKTNTTALQEYFIHLNPEEKERLTTESQKALESHLGEKEVQNPIIKQLLYKSVFNRQVEKNLVEKEVLNV